VFLRLFVAQKRPSLIADKLPESATNGRSEMSEQLHLKGRFRLNYPGNYRAEMETPTRLFAASNGFAFGIRETGFSV
jgi:hypothetical protein